MLHCPTAGSTIHQSCGLFERLANSCALVVVPLTVLAGWSEGVGEHLHHVFWESFWVATLSACALSPLLRQGDNSCAFVSLLESGGKVFGASRGLRVWERRLVPIGVLRRVESALKALGVWQVREKG